MKSTVISDKAKKRVEGATALALKHFRQAQDSPDPQLLLRLSVSLLMDAALTITNALK